MNREIGRRLKEARKKAKLTQKKLSELTGIPEITIRQYEAGKYIPKHERAILLSYALKIPLVNWLDSSIKDNNSFYAAITQMTPSELATFLHEKVRHTRGETTFCGDMSRCLLDLKLDRPIPKERCIKCMEDWLLRPMNSVAKRCEVCGKEISFGYVVDDEHYCERCLNNVFGKDAYEALYDEGRAYWTMFEEES